MMTQTLLDKLKRAYYSGALEVREGDTWLKYQRSEDMWLAIQRAEAELKNASLKTTRQVVVNKGYQ